MAIGSTWNIEWLNQNSQRNYPIATDVSKLDVTDSIELPNDFIVDLSWVANTGDNLDVSLFHIRSVSVFGTGITVEIGYNNTVAGIVTINRATFTLNSSYQIIGSDQFFDSSGILVIGNLDQLVANISGTANFDVADTKLEPTVVRQLQRGVAEIATLNTDDGAAAPIAGDIALNAGTNVKLDIEAKNGATYITINAVSSEGLTADCFDCEGNLVPSRDIRFINGVAPDATGNIQITGDDCIQITTAPNTLRYTDVCSDPCCGCDELAVIEKDIKFVRDEVDSVNTISSKLQAEIQSLSFNLISSQTDGPPTTVASMVDILQNMLDEALVVTECNSSCSLSSESSSSLSSSPSSSSSVSISSSSNSISSSSNALSSSSSSPSSSQSQSSTSASSTSCSESSISSSQSSSPSSSSNSPSASSSPSLSSTSLSSSPSSSSSSPSSSSNSSSSSSLSSSSSSPSSSQSTSSQSSSPSSSQSQSSSSFSDSSSSLSSSSWSSSTSSSSSLSSTSLSSSPSSSSSSPSSSSSTSNSSSPSTSSSSSSPSSSSSSPSSSSSSSSPSSSSLSSSSSVTEGVELFNGIDETGISGPGGFGDESNRFYIDVPAGAADLLFVTSGAGEADLLVRFGTPPDTSGGFDCVSADPGSNESCSFPTPSAGRWYVLITGGAAYSSVTLTASFTAPSSSSSSSLSSSSSSPSASISSSSSSPSSSSLSSSSNSSSSSQSISSSPSSSSNSLSSSSSSPSASLASVSSSSSSSTAPGPSGFTTYQEVTIDNTKVTEDLTDFPVYIDLADLDKGTADIFDTATASGGDIRITDASNNELPRQIVDIDTSAKTGALFVKYTGTLSSSVDTVIKVWYNGVAAEPAADSTYGSENVWTNNYTGIWHLEEDPSGAGNPMLDSTGNGHDGDTLGSMTSGDSIAAKIASGLAFDGSGDHVFITNGGGAHPVNPTTGTVSIWVNPDVAAPSATEYVFRVQRDPNRIYIRRTLTAGNLELWLGASGAINSGANIPSGSWSHILITWNSGTYFMYINGSQVATGSYTGLSGNNSRPAIGAYNTSTGDTASGTAGVTFQGAADEARLSDTVRSAGYVLTEYNNQNTPSTFYSTSNELT